MLITKKPASDQKLNFSKMGAKPKKKAPFADVENAADAKKPGDKKEDAKGIKKKGKKVGKGAPFWAKKAAAAIAAKGE